VRFNTAVGRGSEGRSIGLFFNDLVTGERSGKMENLLALPTGIELVGDYRIKRVLGAGGFGITYLAREVPLNRSVAIKEYFPSDFAARENDSVVRFRSAAYEKDYTIGLERFIEEAQTLARFDHPNIARVFRYFRANNTAYMVLQFEQGRSLKEWLTELGRPPLQDELDAILKPLLEALQLLHKNDFLHRDIAPDNIIIRADGTPVLIDFGSARGDIAKQTRTISAIVKPGYSPFEQYTTEGQQQGPWTDIYSLAATLYHAVTLNRPLDAPTRMSGADMAPAAIAASRGDYRPGFLAAIDHGLALQADARPPSIVAWRALLFAVAARPKAKRYPPANSPDQTPLTVAKTKKVRGRKGGLAAAAGALGDGAGRDKATRAKTDRQAPVAQTRKIETETPAPLVWRRPIQRAAAKAPQPDATIAGDPGTKPRAGAGEAVVAASSVFFAAVGERLAKRAQSAKNWRRPTLETPQVVNRARTWAAGLPAQIALARKLRCERRMAARAAERAKAKAVNERPPPAKATAADQQKAVQDQPKGTPGLRAKDKKSDRAKKREPARRARGRRAVEKPASARTRARRSKPKRAGPRGKTATSIRRATGKLVTRAVIIAGIVTAIVYAPQWTAKLGQGSFIGAGIAPSALTDVSLERVMRGHKAPISAVAISKDGRRIVTAASDGTAIVWDAQSAEIVRTISDAKGPINAIDLVDGRLIVARGDGALVLWDVRRGRKLATYKRHTGPVFDTVFAGASSRFYSVSGDTRVRLWDTRRGTRRSMKGHTASVNAVAYAPEKKYLVTGGADDTVKLWNARRRQVIRTVHAHTDDVMAVAITTDGRMIASGGEDKSIKLWAASTPEQLRTLDGHSAAVTAVAFTPDGHMLASASADHTIRLWDVASGRLLHTYEGHTGAVKAIAFFGDGRQLVSVGTDRTVRIWNSRVRPD